MQPNDESSHRLSAAAESADRLKEIIDRLQNEVTRLTDVAPSTQAGFQMAELRSELDGMAQLIAETRSEVAALLPSGVTQTRFSSASDELDAVVGATEAAASDIMTAAEQIQGAVEQLRTISPADPDFSEKLEVLDGAVLDIFMACSFQDLTGQRIRKVVHALTYIEQRVLSLTKLWQEKAEVTADEAIVPVDTRADAHLLNGPSLLGLSQNDIDSLLSSTSNGAVQQSNIDEMFATLQPVRPQPAQNVESFDIDALFATS